MTLLLIPVAGVALASVQRLTLTKAMDASRSERQMQQQWLMLTLRTTLLNRAAAVMEFEQQNNSEPIAHKALSFAIGSTKIELIFTDEQAKANFNTYWSAHSPRDSLDMLRRMLDQTGSGLPIALRPTPRDLPELYSEAAFGRFEQVFPRATPRELVGTPHLFDGPASAFTLWGSGRLNFQRASAQAIEEICGPGLSLANRQKLLSIRKTQPSISLEKMMRLLKADKDTRLTLTSALTDQSSTFGLWMKFTSNDQITYRFGIINAGVIQSDSW
jgi:hypothetical protein